MRVGCLRGSEEVSDRDRRDPSSELGPLEKWEFGAKCWSFLSRWVDLFAPRGQQPSVTSGEWWWPQQVEDVEGGSRSGLRAVA